MAITSIAGVLAKQTTEATVGRALSYSKEMLGVTKAQSMYRDFKSSIEKFEVGRTKRVETKEMKRRMKIDKKLIKQRIKLEGGMADISKKITKAKTDEEKKLLEEKKNHMLLEMEALDKKEEVVLKERELAGVEKKEMELREKLKEVTSIEERRKLEGEREKLEKTRERIETGEIKKPEKKISEAKKGIRGISPAISGVQDIDKTQMGLSIKTMKTALMDYIGYTEKENEEEKKERVDANEALREYRESILEKEEGKEKIEIPEDKGLLASIIGLIGGGLSFLLAKLGVTEMISKLFGKISLKSIITKIGPKLAKAGGITAIIAGVALMVRDGIAGVFKAKEWGASKISAGLGGALGGMGKGITGAFKNMGKWALIGAGIGTLICPGPGTIAGGLIGAAIGGILGFIGGKRIAKGLDNFAKMHVEMWNMLKGGFIWLWEKIKGIWGIFKENVIVPIWDTIKSIFTEPFKNIIESIKGIGDLWSSDKSLWKKIKGTFKNIGKIIFNYFSLPFRAIKSIMDKLGLTKIITGFVSKIGGAIKDWVIKMIPDAKMLSKKMKEFQKEVGEKGLLETLKEKLSAIWTGIREWLIGHLGPVAKWIGLEKEPEELKEKTQVSENLGKNLPSEWTAESKEKLKESEERLKMIQLMGQVLSKMTKDKVSKKEAITLVSKENPQYTAEQIELILVNQ